ncbi:MAG TPA: peptidylprolyl isomerase [Verrucomicrobiales bacterium]|nr:peptidylprolyl isomerase [Verrucomicrobiales bacterium]
MKSLFRISNGVLSCIAILFYVSGLSGFSQETEGLFVSIQTNLGTFECRLFHEKTPMTVANFVGLAAGTQSWMNFKNGEAEARPYYDGIIFHRVISGFVIQGGSPKGDGTDGPGYSFPDEFDPTLRHSRAGLLSMANSGLNSNGSQFFVTLAPTPHLDDLHSIFGEVSLGMDIIEQIGQVPTDAASKPVTPVVIEHIEIIRRGPAAEAFDPSQHNLPSIEDAKPVPSILESGIILNFEQSADTAYYVFQTPNFGNWQNGRIALFPETPEPASFVPVPETLNQPAYFYRITKVAYGLSVHTPQSLAGRKITMTLGSGQILECSFVDESTGTFILDQDTPGNITNYTWRQEAHRGVSVISYDTLATMQLDFAFSEVDQGNFSGTVFSQSNFKIMGPFTSEDL